MKIDYRNDNIKIIFLGGVEEIGINSTLYVYKNTGILVDLGLGFSEYDYYGIDAIVPNISYIKKSNILLHGIVITHGHLDHIGAIQYLIETLNFPYIYGTQFTIELLKTKLEEKNLLHEALHKLRIIKHTDVLTFENFEVKFFHVNHSIPQSLGLYIKTPSAKIIHTGDFKFDNSPVNEPVTDYAKITEYSKDNIDILLADSTNSTKKGYPISENDVAKNLAEIIERAKGRVIIATFSGLVNRLYQLIDIAKVYNRKVFIAGYSLNQTLKIAQEIGYIQIPQNIIIPIENASKIHPNKIMILTTGAQGEENAGLSLMANDGYKGIKLKKGDTVIISAKTIVGNDKAVQNMIDKISSTGAIVLQSEYVDFFTSGHGYQEDQKIMMNLVKPKFFIPIHGYQYFLRAHAETAKSVGIRETNILIPKRGSIVSGNSTDGFKIIGQIKCEPLIVSGSGVGDVGYVVVKEREQLANFGIIIINIVLKEDKTLTRDPYVVSKGFIYVKRNQEILQKISDISKQTYNNYYKNLKDLNKIKEKIQTEVSKYIFQETERDPVIQIILNY